MEVEEVRQVKYTVEDEPRHTLAIRKYSINVKAKSEALKTVALQLQETQKIHENTP